MFNLLLFVFWSPIRAPGGHSRDHFGGGGPCMSRDMFRDADLIMMHVLQCLMPAGWGTAAATGPAGVRVKGHTEMDSKEGKMLVPTS